MSVSVVKQIGAQHSLAFFCLFKHRQVQYLLAHMAI